MKPSHKTHREARNHYEETSRSSTHFVVMMAFIVMMFLPIVAKLMLSASPGYDLKLPDELALSTIAILGTLPLLQQARAFKQHDDHRKFRLALFAINAAGWLFLALQYMGWRKVFAMPDTPLLTLSSALIVLHGFHFLVAAALLLYAFLQVVRINTSSELYIHFLNPAKEKFYDASCRFWTYLVVLWTGMYAIMLLK